MKFSRFITHFPIRSGNLSLQLSDLSGTLLAHAEHEFRNHAASLSAKIRKAFERCTNPYLLSSCADEIIGESLAPLPFEAEKLGITFADNLIWLSRRQFLCARLYASWRVPLFPSAREATLFFRKHAEGDQDELCLARALFAAKTSRCFPEQGAVIIGVFLPSRAMHAWVIEGDNIADPYDRMWINYQPVAMLS